MQGQASGEWDGVHDKNYHNTLFKNNRNINIWYLIHTNLVLVHYLDYLSIGTSYF
jgi:hypothetical protein